MAKTIDDIAPADALPPEGADHDRWMSLYQAVNNMQATEMLKEDKVPDAKILPLILSMVNNERFLVCYAEEKARGERDGDANVWTSVDNLLANAYGWMLDHTLEDIGWRMSPQREDMPPVDGKSPFFSSWTACRLVCYAIMPRLPTVNTGWLLPMDDTALTMIAKAFLYLNATQPDELRYMLETSDVPSALIAEKLGVQLPVIQLET